MADVDVAANELKLAKTLVDAMTGEIDLSEYRNKYSDDLKALVEAKLEGKELVAVEEAAETEPRTINLMQALEESLKAASTKKTKKPPKLIAPSPAEAAAKGRKRKTS